MLKISSSIFLVLLLSFSCADSPSNETANATTTTTATSTASESDAVTNTDPIAETIPTAETTEGVDVEENTGIEEPTTEAAPAASTPDEEPIKDKARPRTETTPTPAPAPKNNPPATNKSSNTAETGKTIGTKPAIPAFSHDKFDALLRKHVSSSGKVNYKSFKKDKAVLDDYINLLELNAPQSNWSKNKQMAYWINLYNAFTIHTILNNYPVKSITDIEGGKVWDRKTIRIGEEKLTLNDIEKKKLLQRFKDGRVHFAVNCAATSCPPLLNKAWTEDNVQRYLSKQTKAFINNTTENQLSAKAIQISQIFNWYASDFGGKDKVVSYFQKYADIEIKDNAKVTFKEYNWELND
ncbi:MAG: DUF547 domain-containing protein [Aureispira sp.]